MEKDFEYNFYWNDENYSETDEDDGVDDIVSDSSMKKDFDFNDFATAKGGYKTRRYKKKKHGIAGFFAAAGEKISGWWKQLKRWQKAVLISFASLALAICLLVAWVFSYFDYNYNGISSNPEDLGFENVINEDIINIALFGIDTRDVDSFSGLSDSIMILSINTVTKKIKIISIMRDTLVPITYNGKTTYAKINSAYSKGGPELAIKTLNQNFDLDISEYATVNFYGMVDIIDAVGGIDAELTKAEVVSASKNAYALNACIAEICSNLGVDPGKYYITTAGQHHLNGIQAVAYSRIRKVANIWGTTDDYGRTDRQRYVMEQLFNKAVTLGKSDYVKLAKALIPCSETSLSYSEIMGLAMDVLLDSPSFEQQRMPQAEYQMTAPTIKSVGSCVYYDLDFAAKLIHAFIYDDISFEDYTNENGIEKNDWYRKAVGSSSSSSKTQSSSSSKTSSSSSSKTSSSSSSSETSSTSSNNSSSQTSSTSSSSGTSSVTSSNNQSSTVTPPDDGDDKPSNGEEDGGNNEDEEPSDNTTTE